MYPPLSRPWIPHLSSKGVKNLPPGLLGEKALCKMPSLTQKRARNHRGYQFSQACGSGIPLCRGRRLCCQLEHAVQHTDPGLSSCPQILELLCQILQTDSLNAIQFWLLYAPPKGETQPCAQVLWVEAAEGPVFWFYSTLMSLCFHPRAWAFCLGLFSFLEPKQTFSSQTISLLPLPILSRFP